MARLHDIWEIRIRDKISTKSKTANICSISSLQQVRPKQYCFQTNLIEPCHLGKIGLNLDIPSPTKFVSFFSFFKNCATNFKEQTISKFKQSILRDVLLHIKPSTELLRIWKHPYNYFIFERTRSSILSNLQLDNFIHVTRPDIGWETLILNKADYYSKVNAILSDTYNSVSFIMILTNTVNYETRRCYQENRQKNLFQQVISHHQYSSIYLSG